MPWKSGSIQKLEIKEDEKCRIFSGSIDGRAFFNVVKDK